MVKPTLGLSVAEQEFEDDFGFSTVDHISPEQSLEINQKLQKIKSMILPLIDNLMKDPHKDIHWPDRDKKLSKFKKDLLKLIDE